MKKTQHTNLYSLIFDALPFSRNILIKPRFLTKKINEFQMFKFVQIPEQKYTFVDNFFSYSPKKTLLNKTKPIS